MQEAQPAWALTLLFPGPPQGADNASSQLEKLVLFDSQYLHSCSSRQTCRHFNVSIKFIWENQGEHPPVHRAQKQASSGWKKSPSGLSRLTLGGLFILPWLTLVMMFTISRKSNFVRLASSVGTARLCPSNVLATEGKWAAEERSRDVAPISHAVHHQGLLCPSPAQPPANPNCSDKNHTRWKPLSRHRRDQHWAEMQESVILKAGERWANPAHLWKSNCSISFYLHFFHLQNGHEGCMCLWLLQRLAFLQQDIQEVYILFCLKMKIKYWNLFFCCCCKMKSVFYSHA